MSFFRSRTLLSKAKKTSNIALRPLVGQHHLSSPTFFNNAKSFSSTLHRLKQPSHFPLISHSNANGIKPKMRSLTMLLQEIAKDLGLEFKLLSNDWIIMLRDPRTGKRKYMFGNIMGFNDQAAGALCKDKAASSAILEEEGIPHIPHKLFLSPTETGWLEKTGTFSSLKKYVVKYKYDVVIKPTDGGGGNHIYRCKNWRDIEKTALLLFKDNRSLVVSPFESITYEFRIVFLDGNPLLIFKKIRPTIRGDGKKTIRELLIEYLLINKMEADNFFKKFNLIPDLELDRIPDTGELIPVNWKHNISSGATASLEIDEKEKRIVSELAIKAAKAVGAQFVTVDVVQIDNPEKPHYKVMEINSTVTITDTLPPGEEEKKIVKSVYKTAIQKLFENPAEKANLDCSLDSSPPPLYKR